MADQKKFEEMLERLINEDKEGAEELFHEIVVEKSREIYETLLAEEVEEDEDLDEASDDDEDEEVDESADEDDEDEEVDESFDLDEFEVEADPMTMGGDETDDMLGDIEAGDEGDDDMDMGDEDEELEDRVVDLEDALDELKAEFEKMMAGEEGDDEEGDDMDMGDEEGEDDEEEKESFVPAFEAKQKIDPKTGKPMPMDAKKDPKASMTKKSATEEMREYVEKVAPAKMGDNGANTKSTVAGKNDMGGTATNIVRGDTEAGVEANKGQLKGNGVFKGTAKEDDAGNVNVPGGKASKSMKAMPKGHGAEKKGAGETAANKKSTIGS